MRNVVATVLVVLLGAALVWLLTRERPEGLHVGPADDVRVVPGPAPAPVAGSAGGGALGSGPRAAPRRDTTAGAITEHGSLRIELDVTDGRPAPAYPRLYIEAVGPALVHTPLPAPSDGGTWLFDSLPVGAYRLRASAEGYQALVLPVTVERDREARLRVPLVPGAEIAYESVLYSGEVLEHVRLELLDGRGVAQSYVLEIASGPMNVEAGKAVRVPGTSRVVGLKPGTWRLRATADSGETDEETVTVAAGEPAKVRFEIRR